MSKVDLQLIDKALSRLAGVMLWHPALGRLGLPKSAIDTCNLFNRSLGIVEHDRILNDRELPRVNVWVRLADKPSEASNGN